MITVTAAPPVTIGPSELSQMGPPGSADAQGTVKYLTDGVRLYEIASRRTVQNYGLRRGVIRYIVLRDCVSEATATVDDLQLAALTPVR